MSVSTLSETLPQRIRAIPEEASAAIRAFHRYYRLIAGERPEDVAATVLGFRDMQLLESERSALTEKALWLWSAGETANRIGGDRFPDEWRTHAESVVAEIAAGWREPRPHWMISTAPGVYLNNLALYYGAVQSANNTLRSGEAQRLLKDIREFAFARMLVRGALTSRLGETEPYGDIGASAIPFALFNAGDQVLVGAVKTVEERLAGVSGVRFASGDLRYGGCVRSDVTCLLAWYYCELGDLARARRLLEQAEQLWQRSGTFAEYELATARVDLQRDHDAAVHGEPAEQALTYVLYGIALRTLELKEEAGGAAAQGVRIVHRPEGSGSLYRVEACERSPRHPLAEQDVLVHMQTEPTRADQTAKVLYSVDGGATWKSRSMGLGATAEGEKRWTASLGAFGFGDVVTYKFEVTDSGRTASSDEYEFSVRQWAPLSEPVGCALLSEQEAVWRFAPFVSGGAVPELRIRKRGEDAVQWSFAMADEEAGKDDPVAGPDHGALRFGLRQRRLAFEAKSVRLRIVDDGKETLLETYDVPGSHPVECLIDAEGHAYKIRVQTRMADDELWYGTGERFSATEYRGCEVDMYVYNQYKDQGFKTYMPVPFAMSSRGYGVYADTTMVSRFRFGSILHDRFELEADLHPNRPALSLYWFVGSPKDIVQAYASVTGKPKLPPKWAFGPWMSSNNWDSQAETYRQVQLTETHGIPATVLVLEQWSDEATFYIFNDALYTPKEGDEALLYDDYEFPQWGRWPDPKRMVQDLHQRGIRVLLWQIPVIKFMEGVTHAQKDADERTALERGYIVRRKDGEPYRIPHFEWFKGSLVPDFSNPEARRWWFNRRRYLLEDIGVDGFKTDGGECLYGSELVVNDGRSGDELRNAYPNDYIGAYHEFVAAHRGNDGITFSRAGYAGAQRYPLHWAGDERSTFDAFRGSVKAGLNSGLSGIPFWGWDLGGFHGDIPTAELYIRSAQMALFCPVMQYHAETKGEFNQDRTPWNIAERTGTPDTIARYKRLADLRMNLLPYIYDQAIKTSATGIPLMRAMLLEFPDDRRVRTMHSQYMFGDALLVAPVTEEHATTKDVYFPEGRWTPLFGGADVVGPRMATVRAGLDDIPVYARQDSVVALNLSAAHILGESVGNRVDGYDRLTFFLYMHHTLEYEFLDGAGTRIRFSGERTDRGIALAVDATADDAFTLAFHDCRTASEVLLDGAHATHCESLDALRPGQYTIQEGRLYVRADAHVKQVVVSSVDR